MGKQRKTDRVATSSPEISADRLAALKELLPEAFNENNLDVAKLQAVLGTHIQQGTERYSFTWAGKREAILTLQRPSTATLTPAKGLSVDFDRTHNLFIQGDNLEVLKLLYKPYFGHVKMIYIDPPYNTGKDFVYPDNYANPLDTYLKMTGQRDSDGNLVTSNPDTSGRYHSAWLSMMYPRLFLARQLLRDDGVLLASIDYHEIHHLKMILNEVFGEENFVAELIWDLRSGPQAGHFTRSHEYLLVVAKDKASLDYFSDKQGGSIKHGALKKISAANPASEIVFPAGMDFEGKDAAFRGEIGDSEKETIVDKEMKFKDGKLTQPVRLKAGWAMRNQILAWLRGEETVDTKGQKVSRFYFNSQGILWYEKERETTHPKTVLPRDVGNTQTGSDELEEIFGVRGLLDFPKPSLLLKFLVDVVTEPDEHAVVLDFFAGSCTTAQAVLELNREDSGNRRFIMVQLPEPLPEPRKLKDGTTLGTIADIGRERIVRVIKKLKGEKQTKLGKEHVEDLGFRAFTLAESNYKQWDETEQTTVDKYIAKMEGVVDSLRRGWKAEDVIYEVAIKEGYGLGITIEKLDRPHIFRVTDPDKDQFFSIDLDDKVMLANLKSLHLTKDDTFICRDSALDDTTAANLALQCRLKTI